MRASFGQPWRAGTLVLTLLAAGCSDGLIEAPSPETPELNTVYQPARVRLAKVGPAGTTATFSISATSGNVPNATVTIPACPENTTCFPVDVWYDTEGTLTQITVTEIGFTGSVRLERINVLSDLYGAYNIFEPTSPSVTVDADSIHSVVVRFKNVEVETPPPPPPPPPPGNGAHGCTPGFWKQTQHFQYWTAPYTPSTQFSAVFANAFPGRTLLDVVKQGGGGLTALGRHTVAALLNAADSDVDYGWTPQHVIDAFNAAYASGNYESLKNTFEAKNERDCTAKD